MHIEARGQHALTWQLTNQGLVLTNHGTGPATHEFGPTNRKAGSTTHELGPTNREPRTGIHELGSLEPCSLAC